jgi:hypothetical protein
VLLTWRNAPDVVRKYDKMDVSRAWTTCFRENYREAALTAWRTFPAGDN